QVERARLAEHDPRCADCRAREQEILAVHRAEWLGPLGELDWGWEFQRGLLRGETTLAGLEGGWTGQGRVREWAWVAGLELAGVRAAGAVALAGSPHLGRLTSLNLRSNAIGDAGAAALAASPHLARLTSLDLGSSGIGDAGAAALAAS